MSLTQLSATRLASLIARRQVSAVEVMDAFVHRISQVDPVLKALVAERFDAARREAGLADRALHGGEAVGPLHGVPMTLKDSFDTVDLETRRGTLGVANRSPQRDATVVRRLKAAGAILVGKTNTPELTLAGDTDNLVHGPTRNPYDLSRSPGGSSGGAAALVAAEGCAFDVGSDTRGSLRWPAHCCGIAALKPTQGMVSRAGHEPPPGMGVLDRLTHIGPLSRHVEDLELLTSLMAGPDRHDALVVPLPEQAFRPVQIDGLRVGVGSGAGVLHPDPAIRSALEACAAALAHRGVEVDAVDLQPHLSRANTLYAELAAADGGAWILQRLAAAGTPLEQAHPWVRNRIQPGRARSAVELAMIVEAIDALRVEMAVAHTSFDVLLTPVFPGPACVPGAWLDLVSSGAAGYTSIHNLTGWPCVTLRVAATPEGLPIGMQIAAQPWCEGKALAVARYLELVFGGWKPSEALPAS